MHHELWPLVQPRVGPSFTHAFLNTQPPDLFLDFQEPLEAALDPSCHPLHPRPTRRRSSSRSPPSASHRRLPCPTAATVPPSTCPSLCAASASVRFGQPAGCSNRRGWRASQRTQTLCPTSLPTSWTCSIITLYTCNISLITGARVRPPGWPGTQVCGGCGVAMQEPCGRTRTAD